MINNIISPKCNKKINISKKKFSMVYNKHINSYDVIVVGGGHSGCEAAVASSKSGCKTLLITLNLDKIAWQPCNPSIGGPAKSNLVHEVDAIGGIIGKITDRTYLHKKLLNISKGPAVWALRAQTDKREYSEEMKKFIDSEENLSIQEGMVTQIFLDNNKKIIGIGTHFGGFYRCRSVVLTTGTFLGGTIWVGPKKLSAGRSGEMASIGLTENLIKSNIKFGRLKTGTPPRIDSRTIDYSKLEIQLSDQNELWFSFDTREWNSRETLPCYLTKTTIETKNIIKQNLHLSPKYGGFMRSTGPRYCPSIEDKIVRFSNKDEHQIFLEPEGRNINEIYLQGFSTGFPENLQENLIRTIEGLHSCRILRPAYSVDYDFLPATQLEKTLMSSIEGLFFAGQVCGTTGYEEASAQGIVTGLNASLYAQKKSLLTISRQGSFIGTMIDDLVTRSLNEPYRVLTSRSEYRMLLRGDNADIRLKPLGRKYGLVDDISWINFKKKVRDIKNKSLILNNTIIKINSNISGIIENELNVILKKDLSLASMISRPNVSFDSLINIGIINSKNIEKLRILETEIKYQNYITRQNNQILSLERSLDLKIDKNFNFMDVNQISKEGREKLSKIRPKTLREATCIGGISSSDLHILLIIVEKYKFKN
ncbi:glucose inhibited division protein A [Guillardia theta]|uniref:Glucose inhibited division protein A n=1 Tax=Guillardia theta TaxID=55529 RepID=Q9AW00_GUITH|nr:glucose inhibited division protein A [Guillardia theta]CAC27071.1 glucose inhibited division protein A [Guillardia theta]|mmetsp:Transcript_18747/g.61573  ORF Transcript_18747/g.61573 Transcript_18747/m.61573 type:complete len:650 (-) Transcript_18747:13121-15070(-)